MPKQLIVLMKDHYPFGECEQCNSAMTKVLVRKIFPMRNQERSSLMEKVRIVRRLANQRLIKIESVMEEDQSLHILYEYVPIKVETWINNINDQFIENFRDQLIKLSSFLANNFIKIDFQLKNIGMDQNYGPKYFLDLDFELVNNINREKLKSIYIKDITNLFRPYLFHGQQSKNIRVENDKLQHSMEVYDVPADTHKSNGQISGSTTMNVPPACKSNNSKSKEKALERYYQQVNMSVDEENQKILQEFMNVLDNDEEEDTPFAQNSYNSQGSPKTPEANGSTKDYDPHQNISMQVISSRQMVSPISNIKNHSFSEAEVMANFKGMMPNYSQFLSKNETTKLKTSGNFTDAKQDLQQSVKLQCRVKSAIEKSMSAIKKFKLIKQSKA